MTQGEIIEPIGQETKKKLEINEDISTVRRTQRDTFSTRLYEEARARHEKGKPYCLRCAKADFEKAQEELYTKPRIRAQYASDLDVPVEDFDFKEYAKESRFVKKKDRLVTSTKVIDGVKRSVQTTYYEYTCKERGCALSIEAQEVRVQEGKA